MYDDITKKQGSEGPTTNTSNDHAQHAHKKSKTMSSVIQFVNVLFFLQPSNLHMLTTSEKYHFTLQLTSVPSSVCLPGQRKASGEAVYIARQAVVSTYNYQV